MPTNHERFVNTFRSRKGRHPDDSLQIKAANEADFRPSQNRIAEYDVT